MSGVTATDEPTLKALIERTVASITPSITSRRAQRWVDRRRRGTPSQATRLFHVEFSGYTEGPEDAAGHTTGGMTSEVTVSIVTDYSVPHDEVMPLVMADHRDLLQALSLLKKTASNGVWWVESIGTSDLPDDQTADHWQVDHDFTFRYQTARSY